MHFVIGTKNIVMQLDSGRYDKNALCLKFRINNDSLNPIAYSSRF